MGGSSGNRSINARRTAYVCASPHTNARRLCSGLHTTVFRRPLGCHGVEHHGTRCVRVQDASHRMFAGHDNPAGSRKIG